MRAGRQQRRGIIVTKSAGSLERTHSSRAAALSEAASGTGVPVAIRPGFANSQVRVPLPLAQRRDPTPLIRRRAGDLLALSRDGSIAQPQHRRYCACDIPFPQTPVNQAPDCSRGTAPLVGGLTPIKRSREGVNARYSQRRIEALCRRSWLCATGRCQSFYTASISLASLSHRAMMSPRYCVSLGVVVSVRSFR